MNTEAHTVQGAVSESILGGITSSSVTEGIGAISVLILAIIGLAGVFANIVAPVATIVIGGVFLLEGMAGNAAARRLSHSQYARPALSVASSATAGFFGGLAGIVLGILALFRTAPGTVTDVLLAVAVLVFGASLLVGGGAMSRLAAIQDPANPAATMSSGSMLIGLGSVVLGILAVIGLVPMTLVLVALLSLGAGALFRGSSVSSEAV